ncbi:MAG: hypothetical protein EZS28_011593, partial [Streblomastix strix]
EEEDQESNNPQLQWIKLNTNQGFYRVHYQDDWILNALLDELINNQFNSPEEEQTTISRLPQSDRMGIQNDLASLSIKGLIPFASYLLFVKKGYWREQCTEIRQDVMRNIQNPMNMFIEAIVAEDEKNKQVQQQDLNANEDQISVEQIQTNCEERLQADDRLAQAVMTISSNFRSQYFSNVCKIEEEINQDSQKEYNKPTISSELTSIYPSNWNIIEAERRTVLFAIYHCSSQIILPEDRLTGLRCVLQFPSPAMFQSSLILLEEEDADVGIKKQDMQTASFILSGLSAKFWKWIIKDNGIDEKTGKKQYSTFQLLRQRLGIQIIPSFIEYAVQNIAITKDDTDLEKQTAEFFEIEAKNIPPYTLRLCIAKIRENSDLWESQKEIFIMNFDKIEDMLDQDDDNIEQNTRRISKFGKIIAYPEKSVPTLLYGTSECFTNNALQIAGAIIGINILDCETASRNESSCLPILTIKASNGYSSVICVISLNLSIQHYNGLLNDLHSVCNLGYYANKLGCTAIDLLLHEQQDWDAQLFNEGDISISLDSVPTILTTLTKIAGQIERIIQRIYIKGGQIAQSWELMNIDVIFMK